jgi:hypothetical protein
MTVPPWPDRYIDWGRSARPRLKQRVQASSQAMLPPRFLSDADISELTEAAILEAFNFAYRHQRDPQYFQDEDQFNRWLTVFGLREALQLLLRSLRQP